LAGLSITLFQGGDNIRHQRKEKFMSAIVAAFHFLALGIGLGSVFFRGIYLKELRGEQSEQILRRLFLCDTLWGVAAALWPARYVI